MTLRFLAVQLFAAIAIGLPAICFHLARPARMKWKPPTVGVAFERPKQQLANPHEGERVPSERSIQVMPF
jgi:hypothetical protein